MTVTVSEIRLHASFSLVCYRRHDVACERGKEGDSSDFLAMLYRRVCHGRFDFYTFEAKEARGGRLTAVLLYHSTLEVPPLRHRSWLSNVPIANVSVLSAPVLLKIVLCREALVRSMACLCV